MTAVLDKPTTLSAFENDELYEEPVPCSIVFRNLNTGKLDSCANIARYDAFVTCAKLHERTQHYCERCHKGALAGKIDCRVCRSENELPHTCPVTVLASYERTTS